MSGTTISCSRAIRTLADDDIQDADGVDGLEDGVRVSVDRSGEFEEDPSDLLVLVAPKLGDGIVELDHLGRLHEEGGARVAAPMDDSRQAAMVLALERQNDPVVVERGIGELQHLCDVTGSQESVQDYVDLMLGFVDGLSDARQALGGAVSDLAVGIDRS